jgi:tetratricopeptide (TPR) repeat protein
MMIESLRHRVENHLAAFEKAWASASAPDLDVFLSSIHDVDTHDLMLDLACIDLEKRLRAGQAARVETYLTRYPSLASSPPAILELAVHEFLVRRHLGAPASIVEYQSRFPQLQDQLAARLADQSPGLPEIPGYQLGREIGRGGMGVVVEAIDMEFGRPVAVKLMSPARAGQRDAIDRFLGEARVMGRLQHPGIPAVHRVGTISDGQPYLAMRLIRGQTLADLLKERALPSDSRPRYLQIFEQMCQTMAYAHEQGVVHRDLKPSNVMVGAFGEVQVMDWGLAKVRGDHKNRPTAEPLPPPLDGVANLTREGDVVGTPAYMPPEQARGEHDRVDARADVFALGAMLCEILTGQSPYSGSDLMLEAARQASLEPTHQRLRDCGADAELIDLTIRCLGADPDQRPADAAQLAHIIATHRERVEQRLRHAERDRAVAEARATGERRRRRVQLWLAVAVAMSVCLGLAFAWYADRHASERRAMTQQARIAIEAALDQAAQSLRDDRPREARIALAESEQRLRVHPSDDLLQRHQQLQFQLNLLVDIDRIREKRWTLVDGKLGRDAVRTTIPKVVQQHGIALQQPAEWVKAIQSWAIRDQALELFDIWLSVTPDQPGLLPLLEAIDPDLQRNEWRRAVASDNSEKRDQASALLKNARPPARFLSAYALLLRRDVGLAMLRQAWEQQPSSFPLAWNLAYMLYEGDELEKEAAAGYWRLCLALRPKCAGTLHNLGVVAGDKKDEMGAIRLFRQAIEADPLHAASYFNLANALLKQGNADEAIPLVHTAIRLDPLSSQAHFTLGITMANFKQDFDAAVVHLNKAIAIDPKRRDAHFALGVVFMQKNDPDSAIPCLQRAIALGTMKTNGPAYTVLGFAYQAKEDIPNAIHCHEKALECNPRQFDYYGNLHWAFAKTKNVQGEIRCWRMAVANLPQNADAHFNLGVCLSKNNDVEGAIASFRQAISIRPAHAEALCNLGGMLLTQGHFTDAVESLQRGHDIGKKQPQWKYPSGEALREARRLAELDQRLPKVLAGADKPQSAEEMAAFANLCGQYRNRHADAVRLFRSAFALKPSMASDVSAAWRFQAAVSAIRAANGDGIDAPPVAERSRLREQALEWLRAELAAWSKAAARQRSSVSQWLNDPAFGAVRDAAALATLPDDQRQAWEQFWMEVRRVADSTATPSKQ